jgi:hypothetical protein
MNGINRYLMLLCMGMVLVACEEISDPPNSFPLPKKLQSRSLPASITLTGVARILELKKEVSMEIADDRATAVFSALPVGKYRVEIEFKDVVTGLTLLEAKRLAKTGRSAGNLAFSEEDYTYPDTDDDSYSNLDELRVEKNPTNKNNYPIPHRVFITSLKGQGDLSQWEGAGGHTGLLAGDAICMSLAQNAGLTGEYRAWLSDEQEDAYCRVAGGSGKKGSNGCNPNPEEMRAYVNIAGEAIAESLDQLVDKGQMFHAIENNKDPSIKVWTGTTAKGIYAKRSRACSGWSSLDGTGMYGYEKGTTDQWTASSGALCGSSSFRLYCFQVSSADNALPIYKTRLAAKKVFLSSAKGVGDLSSWPEANGKSGVLAGDEICQTLASNAGYANADKFVAWLTDSSKSAIGRLVGEGPWARPDGVLVAENRSDLTDGLLLTGIAQTEKNTYTGYKVWTGTKHAGDCPDCISALNCENWSSASSLIKPKQGLSSSTYYSWSDVGESWDSRCSDEGRLYCLEGGD